MKQQKTELSYSLSVYKQKIIYSIKNIEKSN